MSTAKIFDLYFASNIQNQDAGSSIDYLTKTYGEDIFQQLLNGLLNKNYGRQEATDCWRAAVHSFSEENSRMNWRAVILDYLLSRTDRLDNPCIIETEELQRLQRNAITDGLTALYNQSHFKHLLATTIQDHNARPDSVFSLIVLDLDRFKQFNDRCGHLRGDQALAQIGKLITSLLPENGLAARYGGEEFAVILPNTTLPQAISLAEKIRSSVEQTSFDGEERLDSGKLTISGGVACFPDAGKTSVALFAHADSKLYDAKLNRNCISPRPNDPRAIVRHNFRSIVEILDEKTGDFRNSLSADISYTGILLKSAIPAAVGSNLQLRFPYPFWPADHGTSGRVRYNRSNENRGDYLLGIEFLQPQTDFIEQILPSEIYAGTT